MEADNFYKEKKYPECIDAFFDYLKDDVTGNVQLHHNDNDFTFEIYQGSKVIRGRGAAGHLFAEVIGIRPAVGFFNRFVIITVAPKMDRRVRDVFLFPPAK